MTYQELVAKVQTALINKADASKVEQHIAVQVNVTGDAAGAFYIEVKEGVLYISPNEYWDRDAILTGDDAEILNVVEGKISIKEAAETQKIHCLCWNDDQWNKVLTLDSIIPKKKTRKSTAKVEAVKEKAEAKAEEIKETVEAKAVEIKEKAETKVEEVKEAVGAKAEEIKAVAESKVEEIKEKADDVKAVAKTKKKKTSSEKATKPAKTTVTKSATKTSKSAGTKKTTTKKSTPKK